MLASNFQHQISLALSEDLQHSLPESSNVQVDTEIQTAVETTLAALVKDHGLDDGCYNQLLSDYIASSSDSSWQLSVVKSRMDQRARTRREKFRTRQQKKIEQVTHIYNDANIGVL